MIEEEYVVPGGAEQLSAQGVRFAWQHLCVSLGW